MPGTGSDVAARRELATFLLWHKAMREDARRLSSALAGEAPVDPAGLARWFAAYESAVHQHAVAEDDVLWRAVEELGGIEGADGERSSEVTHDDVEAAACAVAVALEHLMDDPAHRAAAAGAAAHLAAVLDEHLAYEEAVVLPKALEVVGRARWLILEEQARADAGPQSSAFVLPWLVAHADPDELDALLALLPAEAPQVLEERLAPAYRELAAALDQRR